MSEDVIFAAKGLKSMLNSLQIERDASIARAEKAEAENEALVEMLANCKRWSKNEALEHRSMGRLSRADICFIHANEIQAALDKVRAMR